MAVTQSQDNGDGIVRLATGSYITDGTAAAITITIGFTARHVRVVNEDGDASMEWFKGMADAEAMKLIGDTDPMTYAKITSNGITVSGGTFIIGLDTDVNVTSQQLSWIAMG